MRPCDPNFPRPLRLAKRPRNGRVTVERSLNWFDVVTDDGHICTSSAYAGLARAYARITNHCPHLTHGQIIALMRERRAGKAEPIPARYQPVSRLMTDVPCETTRRAL